MAKILFYTSSLNRGGAERVLLSVIDFCKTEHEIILLTDTYAKDEYTLPKDVKRICLSDCTNPKKSRVLTALQRLISIRETCKKEQIQLAIAFMSSSGIRLSLATMFMNIKTAIAIRNDPTDELNNTKKRFLLLSALKKADGVIFQMDNQKGLFAPDIQSKSAVIFNPANEQFCNVIFDGKRNNKIVTVGRLFVYKNQEMLIESFSDIKKYFPDMELYIYGEGEYRKELELKIEQLGLTNSVYLPGAITNVADEIKDAKLFVLPSDTEGMPNTLIEAMLLGLPVISTDCPCGGPRTLIKHNKNGLLIPVRDRNKLTEAMLKTLNDESYAEQLGNNAKEIINVCDSRIIRKQWLEYINHLIS